MTGKVGMLRLGLSLIVTIGISVGGVSAQVLLVPEAPYEPAYPAPRQAPYAPPIQYPQSPYGFHRMLNSHGMGCQTDPWGSCANFHTDFRFIFGSCRDFFGEGCMPNHPYASPHRQR